ncbi:hypothetical protein [Actinoplanes xinjiangensis]|uniref:hypothetical protein n=1 Tax=Actinoplanes xinjiangensis TaxID=512350 RepID=UPI00341F746F
MNQLAKSRINLLGTRLAAIRTLVLDMPPTIAAQALGYTPACAEDHATMAGAFWASYAAHRRRPGDRGSMNPFTTAALDGRGSRQQPAHTAD